jgi:hypothetical protein
VTNGRLNIARALEYLTNANPPAIVISALPRGLRTPTNAAIQVTFNRSMSRASIESAFLMSPPATGSFQWSDDSRSFTFQHDTPFNSITNYTVRIRGTAQDLMGGTLDGNFNRLREGAPADDFVWTFRFPISNDDFAEPYLLAGSSGSVPGDNRYASVELDEPSLLVGDYEQFGASVWYHWVPPAPGGWFTFDLTSGTAFDSLLAIYTGEQLDRKLPVTGNDNYGTRQSSRVSFSALAGTAYAIVVAGKSVRDPNQAGSFALTWYPTPPPVISSFTPQTTYPRQKVTLQGTNFSGARRVLINGVPAAFTFSTNPAFLDLTLTATVPDSATTGSITIETPHGNFTSSSFTVLARPALSVRLVPGTNLVELSWPSTSGFSLQRADTFSTTTTWTSPSLVSSRLTNGLRIVTVTNAGPNRFFRLYKP